MNKREAHWIHDDKGGYWQIPVGGEPYNFRTPPGFVMHPKGEAVTDAEILWDMRHIDDHLKYSEDAASMLIQGVRRVLRRVMRPPAEAQVQGGGEVDDLIVLGKAIRAEFAKLHAAMAEIRERAAAPPSAATPLSREHGSVQEMFNPSAPVGVAEAWQQGYHQGVQDERTSEANIGIAGFGAKVEPARNNPYLAQQPQPINDNAVAGNESAPVNDKNEWVLVPREPTPEMLEKGGVWNTEMDTPPEHEVLHCIWRDMLASAPQPPAEAQGGGECCHSWQDYGQMNVVRCNKCEARAVNGYEDRPFTAPPSAATPLSREHGSLQEMFNPSAPVGVEGLQRCGRCKREGDSPDCTRCGGTGWRRKCDDLDCAEHGCCGGHTCYVAPEEVPALAQQPAACIHSWHDYGKVNQAWCSRCNAVAVIGHEDRPYGVLSVTDDGEYRTDPAQQPAAVDETCHHINTAVGVDGVRWCQHCRKQLTQQGGAE